MLLVIVLVLSVLPVQVLAEGEPLKIVSSGASKNFVIGRDTDFALSVKEGDTTVEGIAWSAEPSGVVDLATLVLAGKLKGVAPGNVTITATLSDGRTLTENFSVYQLPENLTIVEDDGTTAGKTLSTNLKLNDEVIVKYTCDNDIGEHIISGWKLLDNDGVLSFDEENLKLKAEKAGTAKLRLAVNGAEKIETFTVTEDVAGHITAVPNVETLTVGDAMTLTLGFTGSEPYPTDVTWDFTASDDEAEAILTPDGTECTVSAKTAGSGTVTASWTGGSVNYTLTIENVAPLSVAVEGTPVTELTLTGSEEQKTLEVTGLPAGKTGEDIEWGVVSGTDALRVERDGTSLKVSGAKVGTAVVTAKVKGLEGTQASVTIMVEGKSTIANKIDTLFMGDTHTCVLETELLDETAFTWESSDDTVATVSAGVITPLKGGDSTTISVKNGTTVLDSFTVEVKAESRIALDPSMPTELLCGKDMTLSAVLKDAEGKEVEDAVIKWELVTPKANDKVTLSGNKLTALPDLKNPYEIELRAYAVDEDGNPIEEVEAVTFGITVIPQAHQVLLTLNGEDVNGKTIKLNVNDPADAAGIEVVAKINPNTADQGVFWSLDGDGTICTYDPNDFQEGTPAVPASVIVRPIGADKTGTITVTAAARTNKEIKAQFTVEFTKLPTTLEILNLEAGSGVNLLRGGDNLTLHTNLEKDNTLTNRRVQWEVTGVAGATIENGVLNTPAVAARTEIAVTATAEATGVQDTKYITLCPSVASIAITKEDGGKVPAAFNFSEGSVQLKKTVNPDSGYIDAFKWESSDKDENVVTVNQDGLVTFKDAGTVRITCTALDGSNVKTNVNLIIEKKAGSVVITGADELVSGKSTALTAVVYVDDAHTEKAANQKVTWSVVGEDGKATTAASINSKGRLGAKTVSRGVKVTVIARSVENENAYDEFPVIIKPKKAKTLVPYYENDGEYIDGVLYLNPGEEDQFISGLWYDSTATSIEDAYTVAEDCTFFSSNSGVATIDSDGILKTNKKGNATITIRATDPDTNNVYTTKFTVKVVNTVDHVTISRPKDPNLRSGKYMNLSAVVWSNFAGTVKADNQAVTWEIFEKDDDDTFVATKAASISSRGRVTANAVTEDKTVFVVATSKENDGLFDVIELTIRPKYAYTITVYKDTDDDGNPVIPTKALALEMGEAGDEISDLHVNVYVSLDGVEGFLLRNLEPTGGYSWTTSNKKAVGVNIAGDLVYVGNGTAKVNAKIKDGRTTYTSNTVTVSLVKLVDEVKVEKKYSGQELYSGKTLLMKATVNEDATNKAVKWSFENEEDYKVASINERTGLIRAKKGLTKIDTVTVVATAVDGSDETDSMDVTIYPLATKVEITAAPKTIDVGDDTQYVEAKVLPFTLEGSEQVGANQKVKWSSNRSSVLAVDEDGNLTAKRRGTATIKAKAVDGSGKYATIKITVVNP